MANGNALLLIVDHIGTGGAEKALKRLSDQVGDQFESIYMTSNYPADKDFDFGSAKYVSLDIKERAGLFGKVFTLVLYFYGIYCLKKKFQITHSISFLERSNIVNVFTSFFFKKIKTFTSVRNNLEIQYNKFGVVARFVIKIVLSVAYKISPVVVCLSKSVESDLRGYLVFGCESLTIYNGYNFDKIVFVRDEEKVAVPALRYKFIAIGRLSEQKGLDILISAIAKSHEFRSCASLDIYGEGEDEEYIQGLIDGFQLSGVVNIKKPISNILNKINDYDAFLFPSRWEGFGNALLEAISNRLPIVSSDCHHGPAEMLGLSTGVAKDKPVRVPVGYLYRDPVTDPNPILSCMLAIELMLKDLKRGFKVDGEFVENFKLNFSEIKSRSEWLELLNCEKVDD